MIASGIILAFRGVVVAVGSDFAKAPLSAAFEPCPERHAHHARRSGRIPSPFGPALRVAQRLLSLLFTSKVLCDPQPRFDATHRLRQLSEYNSRYRLPVARQEILRFVRRLPVPQAWKCTTARAAGVE
jgi:hypothetical protein